MFPLDFFFRGHAESYRDWLWCSSTICVCIAFYRVVAEGLQRGAVYIGFFLSALKVTLDARKSSFSFSFYVVVAVS